MRILLPFLFLYLGKTEDISFAKIPECYMSYAGTETYLASDTNRRSVWVSKSRTLSISKKKRVSFEIVDYCIIQYSNASGNVFVEVEFELSNTKKYKQYGLEHFKKIDEFPWEIPYAKGEKTEFEKNGFLFYGFNANDPYEKELGQYSIYTTDKLGIHIRFRNVGTGNAGENSFASFLVERDKFLDPFTKYLSSCIENK